MPLHKITNDTILQYPLFWPFLFTYIESLISQNLDLNSLVAQTVKETAYNVEDPGSIPGLGRSLGDRNRNPFQYSCLENPMDGGAW